MQDQNTDQQTNDTKEPQETAGVEALKQRVTELENSWKRALADYKNLEKRVEEQKMDLVLFANEMLISKLLPIVDNLQKLEKHVDDQGLKLIVRDFKNVLLNSGIKEIDAQDKEFDPIIMEAVDLVEGDKNKVIEVVEPGYLLNDKLIRPAKVVVGKGK